MFQNQDNQTDLKIDVEFTLKNLENQHRVDKREFKFDNSSLKVQEKEQELNQNEYVFALKMDYDKNTTQLSQEYERAYKMSKLNTI